MGCWFADLGKDLNGVEQANFARPSDTLVRPNPRQFAQDGDRFWLRLDRLSASQTSDWFSALATKPWGCLG